MALKRGRLPDEDGLLAGEPTPHRVHWPTGEVLDLSEHGYLLFELLRAGDRLVAVVVRRDGFDHQASAISPDATPEARGGCSGPARPVGEPLPLG